jgi:methanogenic corrinoid protein MtbC1
MTVPGERFGREEVFVPELITGGEVMKAIADELRPRTKVGGESDVPGGTVVVGIAVGDIHDIGKDIVVLMLDVNGYEVHDLGIDVPVDRLHKGAGAS